ncbi:MAG TPA: DinB family protein [Candidatus Acidoferrales bacterium]|nr:DinB family protein [Candidatus Acidoferrales bacterium]
MPIADSMLMEIDMEEKTTRRVLERIPENKLTWKPHPKAYSLGQLAMHIAVAQGRVATAAINDVHEFAPAALPDPKSCKEIMDALSASTSKAKQVVKSFDDAQMMKMWTLKRDGKVLMSVPRVGFLRAIMLNHIYHHRGQLSTYIKLLDIPVPSIYGPSADENPFA